MDFPLTFTQFLLASCVTVLGAILQGSVGFGLGPLCVPLLVLIFPGFVPGPLLLAAALLTSLMFFREKQAINYKEFRWAVLGRLSGTLAAAFVLYHIMGDNLEWLFALMVLVAVALSLSGLRLAVTGRNIFIAAGLSGFMGTIASIGGAPMALIYQHNKGPQLRGTLSGIFLTGTLIALGGLAFIGRFGRQEIVLGLSLMPAIITGFFLSHHALKTVDGGLLRPLVLTVSSLAALVLLAGYFFH